MPEHLRKPLRIPDHDYSLPGAYFVTICTQMKQCFFGSIANNKVILSEPGKIAYDCWREIPQHFPSIELGGFVIMPNHMHGVLIITDDEPNPRCKGTAINNSDSEIDRRGSACRTPTIPNPRCAGTAFSDANNTIHRRGTACRAPTMVDQSTTVERFGKPVPGSIPTIIRSYKSAVTNRIHKLPGFEFIKIWQRNYYEHIIRSNDEWARIDAYIDSNPMNWAADELFGV